jgi:CRISPR/Cas system-associated exonuclease Cas4 (RecB family)
MPDNIYISASMIKDYLDCPRKVYYRINHPDLSVQTPDMIVGNIVHSTLERAWSDRDDAILYSAAQVAQSNLSGKYIDKVALCVNNFFDFFQPLVTGKDEIEYKFKIPYGRAFIVGKMDRVTSGGYVIDWKTSTNHTSNVSRDPQFILYHYVYEQIFKIEPTLVLRANLIDGSLDTYLTDKIMEYSIINSVIPIIIESLDRQSLSPTGLFSGKCSRCPYLDACHKDLGY